MSVRLLGDKQTELMQACSAIRRHRIMKWGSRDVDCEFDLMLYEVLNSILEKERADRDKGEHSRRFKKEQ